MKSFKHFDAQTLDGCLALLTSYNGRARPIAGGTDLLGVLKDRILPEYPEALVNLKAIPDLERIEEDGGCLTIGPMARLADVAADPIIRKKYGVLAEAAEAVATPVIRKMATIGGNLCQDVRCWYYRYPHSLGGRIDCFRKGGAKCPAVAGDNRYHAIMNGKICFAVCPSDVAVALSVLEAEIIVQGAEGGRTIPMEAFYTATGNALEHGEIVTGIRVPEPPVNAGQKFLKFTLRRPVDFALVSTASIITVMDGVCTEARIALGAVAPMPVRAREAETGLIGRVIDEAAARAAAKEALAEARPLSMNAYKVDIAKALIQRSILACV